METGGTVDEATIQRQPSSAVESTERLVDDINRVWNRSAVSTLVAVGELIVGACYGGSIERWRNRELTRSLKRLVEHGRLPFARKTIYLALHFFDLSLRFPQQRFLQRLGVGHVRAVLGLPEAHQEELLSGAQQKSWTIVELSRRAAAVRKQCRRRSGRPPVPPEMQLRKEIVKRLTDLERLLRDPLLISGLSSDAVRNLTASLREMQLQMASHVGLSPSVL